MKRRLNQNYQSSMEALSFSKEAKENMVHKLMQKQKDHSQISHLMMQNQAS